MTQLDGTIRWTLTPAGQTLFTPTSLTLQTHVDAGRTTTIKHGAHRTVYRVQLGDATVYWKHCRLNGSRAWWREILRGPKARLEFTKLQALAARGIASIEPLGWGRFAGRWPRGSFLITRELADAVPLDEYLRTAHFTPDVEREVTELFATWVAKVHAAGVYHPDFHPGNILVRATDTLEFFLIDVHDVELYDTLTSTQRERSLLLLNRWFQMRTDRTQRRRFLHSYNTLTKADVSPQQLETQTNRSSMHLWQARDARCLRNNRDFKRVAGIQARGYTVQALPVAFGKLPNGPDDPFTSEPREDRYHCLRTLKDSRSSTVVELDANGTTYIYKRFRVRRWYDPLTNLVRPSPALRSWKMGHAMIARGLPTPLPLLLLHRRGFGPGAGYLLCEKIVHARHLHEAVATATPSERAALRDQLARLLRLMHDRCLSHRDLKPANILVTAQGALYFIDLVGVQAHSRVSAKRRIRDLVRLNAGFLNTTSITRTERLRFLRLYLCWALHGKRDWKTWWRAMALGTAAKVRKNAQRQRPLS